MRIPPVRAGSGISLRNLFVGPATLTEPAPSGGGVSVLATETADEPTAQGMTLGTLAYMAPEQL